VSEWLLFNDNSAIFQLHVYHLVNFQWDDDEVRLVLDQDAELEFYTASSLKQQSVGRHVAPLGHIILIPSQPVFALTPWCCVLNGEATNFTIFVSCIEMWVHPQYKWIWYIPCQNTPASCFYMVKWTNISNPVFTFKVIGIIASLYVPWHKQHIFSNLPKLLPLKTKKIGQTRTGGICFTAYILQESF
jgi:hypothetical protein